MSFIINPFMFAAAGAPSGLSTFWLAGADHESTTAEKWPDTAPFFGLTSGITDAHGICYNTNAGRGRTALGSNVQSLTARMRYRPIGNTADREILGFWDTTSTPGCCVRQLTTGAIRVTRGSGGTLTTLATSSAGLWSVNNWYYLEFMAVIDNAGSYSLKLWDNSESLLATLSGSADTQETANAYATHILWGDSTTDPYIEDLSIDISGGLLDAPSRIETLYPSAAGDLSDWPRGGTDTGNNYDQVNEAIKDTTSYVQSTAADQYDSYNIDNRSITGTPYAVQVNALARAGAAGTQTFKLLLRIGGVTYEGTKTQSVTNTGADINCFEVWSDNPATGYAWTDADINSLQIGYRSTTSNVRVHQCCAEVLVAL